MDTDAAKEPYELREQNGRSADRLAEAEPEKDELREVMKGKFEPSGQTPRRGHARLDYEHLATGGVQSRWACPIDVPTHAGGVDTGRS